MSDTPGNSPDANNWRTRPSPSPSFTWGNVASIIATLVTLGTVAVQWGIMQNQINANVMGLSVAGEARTAFEIRLRAVEVGIASSQTRLQGMADSITEIKDAQREILNLLRYNRESGK